MSKNKFIFLKSGKLCPFNSNEWEDWKRKWDCKDPESYHCIPDQYNRPGQICVKPNWASKNYCPIFNTDANDIDLIPCDLQYGVCSDTDYRTNEVYQYAGCLNNTHQKVQETSTTDSAVIESPIQPHIIILAVAVPVVLLLVTIGIVFYCCRRKGRKYDANDIELQPLLHQNTVPWSFLKTINYLENKVFCPTKPYELAIGTLATYGHTTLIGPPGSGKTFMAVQLARQQCGKKENSQMFFCNTLQDITTLPELKNVCMYIILDDWLNHYAYFPSKVKEDKQLFDHIFEDFIKYKKGHIIFTVQEDIWHVFKHHLSKYKLFRSKSCVSINNKSFDKEMQHVVRNHVEYCKTKECSINTEKSPEEETLAKDELIEKIKIAIEKDLKSDKEFSLQVMIDLISANTSLVPSRTIFFKDEFSKILQTFLHDWMTVKSVDEKNSFCIFVFAALRGGKITLANFTSQVIRPIYENVCKAYGSECLEDIESIEVLLRLNQHLKGCLYQEKDVFVFHHDSLLCFVLQFLIQTKTANFLIQNADMEILLRRCWIKEPIIKIFKDSEKGLMPSAPAGAVIIPIDALKDLAKRIQEEVSKGFFILDWPKHVFMEHETFSKMWKEVQTESVVANSDKLKGILPVSDECQKKLSNESRSKKEEITQNIENDAESNAPGNDLSLNGGEDKSKQNKNKEKKSKDKASKGKKDSNSKKSDFKEEAGESSVELSQQKKLSKELIEVKSPGNDLNPDEHAEDSRQREQKSKKSGDKVSLDKTQTKSKKQDSKKNKNNEKTPEQRKISSDLTAGDTPV